MTLFNTKAPGLNLLVVWEGPRDGGLYVIGADPAEGNPQRDESAACVMDAVTRDQVACWAGRFEPATVAISDKKEGGWSGTLRRDEVATVTVVDGQVVSVS